MSIAAVTIFLESLFLKEITENTRWDLKVIFDTDSLLQEESKQYLLWKGHIGDQAQFQVGRPFHGRSECQATKCNLCLHCIHF